MIDLNRKQQIILDHLDGMANRQIAAKMHMSKDTVNKYVKEYDEKKAALLASDPDADQKEIIQAFVEEPHMTPQDVGRERLLLNLRPRSRSACNPMPRNGHPE